jgi:hypothetical protein
VPQPTTLPHALKIRNILLKYEDLENKILRHDDVISFISTDQKKGQSDKTILSISKTNAIRSTLPLDEELEDLMLMPFSRNALQNFEME